MVKATDDANNQRCRTIVATLSAERVWGLGPEEQQRYADSVQKYAPPGCSDEKLRQIVVHFQADHALVEALRDQMHPGYNDAWRDWMKQVIVMLHRAGLNWSSDAAIDADDLVQVARLELARSLDTFRYGSKLSTWTYQVVIQSVRRYLRNCRASKRSGPTLSLDQMLRQEEMIASPDDPEQAATASALADLANAILSRHPDARLAQIFRLWALGNLSTEEIGPLIRLHPSRVRRLLHLARRMLQEHRAIQQWRDDANEDKAA